MIEQDLDKDQRPPTTRLFFYNAKKEEEVASFVENDLLSIPDEGEVIAIGQGTAVGEDHHNMDIDIEPVSEYVVNEVQRTYTLMTIDLESEPTAEQLMTDVDIFVEEANNDGEEG